MLIYSTALVSVVICFGLISIGHGRIKYSPAERCHWSIDFAIGVSVAYLMLDIVAMIIPVADKLRPTYYLEVLALACSSILLVISLYLAIQVPRIPARIAEGGSTKVVGSLAVVLVPMTSMAVISLAESVYPDAIRSIAIVVGLDAIIVGMLVTYFVRASRRYRRISQLPEDLPPTTEVSAGGDNSWWG